MKIFCQIFVLCLIGVLPAFPQAAPIDYEAVRLQRIATAARIHEKISLDGRLEEPAWKLAVPLTGFTQREPKPGQPSPERTEVRILYDDDNLYVGVECFDSDAAHMVVTELKEDFSVTENDGITVIIDSLHDRRSGFALGANPSGAKRDSQITNDNQSNNDWDGVWDVKVSRNPQGYAAEFMIPFKTLRFSDAPSQEWGFNVSRRILRLNEESHWSPVPFRYRGPRIGSAGTLTGLEGIHQGRNLKIKPFLTAGFTESRNEYDGGVDAKFSLTPSLTLDTTYRTDFAQVEVDQQQVNLTRFNLFFPEKRDFFLENSGIFSVGAGGSSSFGGNTNLSPFFSRRIGLSAGGARIPIAGGARVTGRVNRYDVGFLAMKTERLGSTPSNNFAVGRVKRNFLKNSWIGGLVTNRDSTIPGDYNRVYGADAYFQFYDRLEFDSYLLGSGTPNRTGRNQARKFAAAWRDDELVIAAEYNSVQTSFNPEMGFIRRRDVTNYSGDFSWLPRLKNSRTIRNLVFTASMDYYQNPERKKVETRTHGMTVGAQFLNGGSITLNVEETFDRLANDFLIRSKRLGHPSDLPIPAGDYKYLRYTTRFSTNQRRRISGTGTINLGEFWKGHRKTFTGGLGLKPNYHFTLDLNLDHNKANLPNGSFATDLVGARFVYAFSPRAFLDAFFQYNADTHLVSSNIRFNIIHHPLSDLYLVYNDSRYTRNGQPVERAFMIKLTNLFNF